MSASRLARRSRISACAGADRFVADRCWLVATGRAGKIQARASDYRPGWAWNDAPDDMSRYGFVRGYVIERPRQATVPLPATLPLLGIGIAAVGVASRRKHSR